MSRLIDADALWEKMYKYSDNEGAKMPYGDDDSLIHKDSACFLIENAPTIEPERKKGKWIKNPEYIGDDTSGFIDNHFSCSECKKEAEINSWGFYILSDFCPHCGADMREGEQDEIN